ncbi:MAG: VWA domain-containing protein [Acidobacteria bacterium]|nr:VWA domain-containing protein [Acidobacteriota bacterium]
MNLRQAAILALLIPAASLAAMAQNANFSTRVEAVRVDVLVAENGRPVRDLGLADFEVLDNGVKQQVDLVSFEQLPLNVVLTLDMSDSVVGERLLHLRSAGLGLLDGLKKGDQAALITFNHMVVLGADLTADWSRVRKALEEAEPTGNTSVVDASFTGMMLGESDVGRALVIVFSDGLDTSSWLTPGAVLDISKRCDAVVYAVSAGQGPKPEFLSDLSEQTGGRLFEIESTKSLSVVFRQVLDEFRQRYLVSYSPSGVPAEGWHRLSVRVKGRNVQVKARPGYLAGY